MNQDKRNQDKDKLPARTAGPWEFERNDDRIVIIAGADCGSMVAEVPALQEHAEGDARLIAAAPDLLEATLIAYRFAAILTNPEFFCDLRRFMAPAYGELFVHSLAQAVDHLKRTASQALVKAHYDQDEAFQSLELALDQ